MARTSLRLLSFPMVRDAPPKPPSAYVASAPQTELSGFAVLRQANRVLADPNVLVLRLRHELLRVERLAPYMDANAILRLEGELALFCWAADAIEADLKRHAERAAKATHVIA